VGKRSITGGDIQLTLHDGQTLLVEDAEEWARSDSIVVSNEDDEIVAHFVYEEGALVTAVDGAHAGEVGRIEEIQVTPGSAANNVLVPQEEFRGEGFETVAEYVVVIDENFTDGAAEAAPDAASEEGTESQAASEDSAEQGGEAE
jgi:small subunit ribosomal protein S4e